MRLTPGLETVKRPAGSLRLRRAFPWKSPVPWRGAIRRICPGRALGPRLAVTRAMLGALKPAEFLTDPEAVLQFCAPEILSISMACQIFLPHQPGLCGAAGLGRGAERG